MHIHVKVFASLKRYLPEEQAKGAFDLEVPDGASLGDVVRLLALPAEEVKVTFVNGRTEALSYRLREGDDVGIFPPLAGG